MQLKTLTVLAPMVLLVGFGSALTGRTPGERNLQVLPKDISDEKLDSIMHTYNKALGVNCQFCHVEVKGFKDSLDYASDKEPMKTEARKMMRLTIELNSKYFYFDSTKRPEYLNTVTCKTCHQGEAFPPAD